MSDDKIRMVDLQGQYLKIKDEVDAAIQSVIDSTAFINGPAVTKFAGHLAEYTGATYVIPCANGTDALQIALMALGLQRGDEVIVPAFTYVASAEVIALLGLTPVLTDIDPRTFNIDVNALDSLVSPRTKAIIPVHLFGQSCDMAPLLEFAGRHGLFVVEDNAQSLGATYRFPDGTEKHTGTMGHFGCTSFFPSKNLGCYGDGGALMTSDPEFAARAKMIANHGQSVKYHHDAVGCNSRLDTIQAAILDVKLRKLDEYCEARRRAAAYYSLHLKDVPGLEVPFEASYSTHVYHQYTLRIAAAQKDFCSFSENRTSNVGNFAGQRDALKEYLASCGIPSMIYYPLPLHFQKAYSGFFTGAERNLRHSEEASASVLSLPMHTELTEEVQDRIIKAIKEFFKV